MKGQIIIIAVIAVVGINLVGCGSSERIEFSSQKAANISREKPISIGMSNPAALYCVSLGYKYKIVEDGKGDQYGFCIFPDGSEGEEWAFYRGKSNQEWSYCKQHGYDLKDLGPYEGAFKGAVCIDKVTKEKKGTVFDLFLHRYLSEPLPQR